MPTARRLMMMPPKGCPKQANWWEIAGRACVGAWQAKGAASLADSYKDLSGSGHDLTTTVPPAWTATDGWVFTGAQWLDTHINPSEQHSPWIRYSECSGGGRRVLIGVQDVKIFEIEWNNSLGMRAYWCIGGASDSDATKINPSGIAGYSGNGGYYNCYKGGEGENGTHGTPGTVYIPIPSPYTSTLPFTIGAKNTAAGKNSFLTGKVQAVAIYSEPIELDEIRCLSERIKAL